MPNLKLCSIEGCGKPVKTREWCSAHYQRLLIHGNPLGGGPPQTPAGEPKKFIDIAIAYQGDDCLFWPFADFGNGRPQFRQNGKGFLVYRVVCEAVNGPPPSPKHGTAHSCGKGHLGCITPKHLRWATVTENMADQLIHGTRAKGERQGSAKLTESQVIQIRRLAGSTSQTELGAAFGVNQSIISDIVRRRIWRHVI